MTTRVVTRRALRSDAAATRQRVLDAAVELARSTPIESVTMRDIAQAADVSTATAYTYFGSREHVFAEAYLDGLRTLTERLRERPPTGRTAADRVASVFRRAVEGAGRTGRVVQATAIAMASSDPAVAPVRPYIDDVFEEWMSIALGDAEIEDRAAVITALQLLMFGGFVTVAHGRLELATVEHVFDVAVRRLVVERGRRSRSSGAARGRGV